MQKIKIRCGLDVGKNGSIAIFNGDLLETFPMPVINKEYDIHAIANIFLKYTSEEYDIHVVLEDLHAIYGSSAGGTFDFGRGLGIIEGVLAAYSIPYTKVMPKKWQKDAFEGIGEIRKPASAKQAALGRSGGLDTKAMALLAVKRLYPNQKLTFGERAKKPHDGMIDAILLSRHCKLNF